MALAWACVVKNQILEDFFNELAELRCVKTRRISDRTSVVKQKWGKPRQSKFHSRFPFAPSSGLDKDFHHQQRVSHKFLFVVLRLFIDLSNCSKTFSIRLSYISSLTKCPMLKMLKHIQNQVFRSRILPQRFPYFPSNTAQALSGVYLLLLSIFWPQMSFTEYFPIRKYHIKWSLRHRFCLIPAPGEVNQKRGNVILRFKLLNCACF